MENYFRTWKWSLYEIPHERIEHLKAQEFEDDMYIDEANYTAAVMLLKKENIQSAERFIEYAISKDVTSIHAWCNKGLYHLMESPPRIAEAQVAKSKMETLRQLEGPLKTARVEYANWLFQKDKSDDAKRQALEMMEADLGSGNRRQNEEHNFSHHYLYAKVLLATAADVLNDETSLVGVLQKFVDQLTVLASSHDPKFEIQTWLSLADVQKNWECERIIQDKINLAEFRNVTGCDNVNLETCVQRIKELTASNTDLQVKSNFYARVGEVLQNVARKNNDEKKRKELLERALGISEIANVAPSCNDRKPLICGRILLDLWAIEYWKCNRGEVEEAYRKHNLLSAREGKRRYVWYFLATEYYRIKLEESDTTRPLLEKAKGYLSQRIDSRRSHFHPEYLRVLMLLGESQNLIKEKFDILYQSAEFDLDRGCILRHQGRFLETIGRHSEAAKHYKDAKILFDCMTEVRSKRYNLEQIEKGLKRLHID